MKKYFVLMMMWFPLVCCANTYQAAPLQKPYVQLNDPPSLQRGAKFFMSNCLSCHSLQYTRYEQVAEGIGFVDENGQVDQARLEKELIFTGAKPTDPIVSSMTKAQAEQVYGVAPPDLTLSARSRGNKWLYTYFRSFYHDASQPSGSNNLLFPNVAMPNLFEPIQGRQEPIFKKKETVIDGELQTIDEITGLTLVRKGSMNAHQFNQAMTDLVAFLDYVGEPNKLKRYRLGVWVLLFLSIFTILIYLLKREFWKNIH